MVPDPAFAGGGDLMSLVAGVIMLLVGGSSNAIPVAAMLVAGFLI
jgi:hypothetical protein